MMYKLPIGLVGRGPEKSTLFVLSDPGGNGIESTGQPVVNLGVVSEASARGGGLPTNSTNPLADQSLSLCLSNKQKEE